jgi:NitT/TauT family transport system permease protein
MTTHTADMLRIAPSNPASQSRRSIVRRYPQLTISPTILAALLAAWWLASNVLGAPAYILPPPQEVLQAAVQGLSRAPWDRAGYWYHAGITVWEALAGFVIGSGLGAFLGLVLSHWPLVGRSCYPYIVGFQSLPKVALAPLMVVWFGFGLEGKVLITAIITFFPVLVNTMAGYHSVEPERIELARSCNASERHLLTKIVIPSCLPFLFAGLGVASVLSILGAVVGEFVGARARPRYAADAVQPVDGDCAAIRDHPASRADRFSDEPRRGPGRAPLLFLGAARERLGAAVTGNIFTLTAEATPCSPGPLVPRLR